jgi:endonuclease YncB( thermonuclease family)
MQVFGEMRKFTLRFKGIDAPEMRGVCPETKRRALAARNRTLSLITGSPMGRFEGMTRGQVRKFLAIEPGYIVEVHCGGYGKYGRVLADLYKIEEGDAQVGGGERVSFSDTLMAEGYAAAY